MGGSSSRTVTETDQTTNNEYNTIGQELSDNALGIVGDGNDVNYMLTDHGMVDAGLQAFADASGFARDASQSASDTVAEALRAGNDSLQIAGDNIQESSESALNFGRDAMASNEAVTADAMNFGRDALLSNENVTADALNMGRDSIGVVERIASDSQIGAMDTTQKMKEMSEYLAEQGINAALTGAGMGQDLAREAIFSNTDTTREALQTNNQLASNFGELLTGFATDNQAVSEAQASQYAQNLLSFSESGQDMARDSISVQQDVAESAMNQVGDVAGDSLMFADQQNQYLSQTLGDNSDLTQTTLLNMAQMQERSLDSALQVAGSVAMDDSAEAATNQTKYLALAMAVAAVAFALRGGKQ